MLNAASVVLPHCEEVTKWSFFVGISDLVTSGPSGPGQNESRSTEQVRRSELVSVGNLLGAAA